MGVYIGIYRVYRFTGIWGFTLGYIGFRVYGFRWGYMGVYIGIYRV